MMSLDEAMTVAHDDKWDHSQERLREAGRVLALKDLEEPRLVIELKLVYLAIIQEKLELDREEVLP